MFLYWALFNEIPLERKSYSINGKYYDSVIQAFGDLLRNDYSAVESCIAYYSRKESAYRKCYEVKNVKASHSEGVITISYNAMAEIDLESSIVANGLYHLAKTKEWIKNNSKFTPILCFLDEADFTKVRKGIRGSRKHTSVTAEIHERKMVNDWSGICGMFEPLENLEQNNLYDIWNSSFDLSELAFACSKQGEPKNRMERDEDHLAKVKRYREASIRFFQRCEELNPEDHRYPAALGYRHYLSVIELTKPKGRRDGNVDEEIEQAIACHERALSLYPDSVKNHYRMAKVLEKKLNRYMYAKERIWSTKELQERDRLSAQLTDNLQKAIDAYRALTEDKQAFSKKEYVKALYSLSRHLIETIYLHEKEYIKGLLFDEPIEIDFEKPVLYTVVKTLECIEECCKAEYSAFFEKSLTDSDWVDISSDWAVSALDKFYRLGLVYWVMYYIKIAKKDTMKQEEYFTNAKKYLQQARRVGDALRARGGGGRSTWHISEKMAWLYILHGENENAIRLLRNARDSYIKNTYAVALCLTNDKVKQMESENVLIDALADRFNLDHSWSATLLCWLYELTGQEVKKQAIIAKHESSMSKTYLKLLLPSQEEDYEA